MYQRSDREGLSTLRFAATGGASVAGDSGNLASSIARLTCCAESNPSSEFM